MNYGSNTKTDTYAFICVKDTNRKAMNLNIRPEGTASTIGGVWYEFNEDGVCLGKKNN